MKIELMIYVSILKIYIKLGKFEQFNIFAITIIAKKYIITSRYSVKFKETIKKLFFSACHLPQEVIRSCIIPRTIRDAENILWVI